MAGHEIANVDQAAAWDGDEGKRWADNAERYERSGSRHWERFLARVAIEPAERVLDFGCGTGRSTRDLGRLAKAGSVLGLDLSGSMLAYARAQAEREGLDNVTFEQGDAQVYPFAAGEFDLAVSRFGCMFFADPVAAFSNIGRALRPGGRLALLAWRGPERNSWVSDIVSALAMGRDLPTPPAQGPSPFGLSQPDLVTGFLRDAGYEGIEMEPFDEPMWFGADLEDAFTFMSGGGIVKGLVDSLDPSLQPGAIENLRALFAAHVTPDGVLFDSSSWVITAAKP